jgi:acetoacetyl-CoA synthetase
MEPDEPMWTPSDERVAQANLTRYMDWLARERDVRVDDYSALWEWSVTEVEAFWDSIWSFCQVEGERPDKTVLGRREMPGTSWFPGTRLNYAEHALGQGEDDRPAIVARTEDGPLRTLTYRELRAAVGAAAAGLRRLGVGEGDRVVAYLPNVPETVIAFLATASLGAIWSSCAPEFGSSSVVDRFAQIEPKVLLAVTGYAYGGKRRDRSKELAAIRDRLPTLDATVVVPVAGDDEDTPPPDGAMAWSELLSEAAEPEPVRVAFDHPLWVLYSSGTTGLPKAIVQGQGGILLEHLKHLTMHLDAGPEDKLFWFTTTGWMMWNFIVGGLLTGSTVLLYDGNPGYPDLRSLWRFAAETGMTYFGTSAAFVQSSMKAGVEPAGEFDLSALRGIGSTGSPLSEEGFGWLQEHVGEHIPVQSMSGGTDVCTAFVGACPILPVYPGEIQCRTLGAKVEAFDPDGNAVIDEVGELVVTEPLPSMPLSFWNDPDGERLRESYFDMWPGVWRHGDWLKVTPRGGCVISGRSDSTLNRGGVRMGTAEFYRVVEALDEVTDSLVVDVDAKGGGSRLLLFVVLREGAELDDDLRGRLTAAVRSELSPRHTPDEIHAVADVPRTLSGKKLEVPVKRILAGVAIDKAVSQGALANPDALDEVVDLAREESG